MIVEATHDDFLALMDSELSPKVRVHCRHCKGLIKFFWDDVDALMSTFECIGTYWSNSRGCYVNCHRSYKVLDIEKALPSALQNTFYVEVDLPEEKIHKLCLEEHVGRTAYSYLREATPEEYREEAKRRLTVTREKAREGLKRHG